MSRKFSEFYKAFLLPLNKQWCFASTEQSLNRGQIEFGSKLRAHKFE